MKKKIILIIVVILAFVGIGVGSYIYSENNYFAKHLICELQSNYTNYNEEFDFMYVDDVFYSFDRKEEFSESKDSKIEDTYELFLKKKEELSELVGNYFDYSVKLNRSKKIVTVKTHIKVLGNTDFYNDYFKDKGLTDASSIKEIKEKLGDDYICREEKE